MTSALRQSLSKTSAKRQMNSKTSAPGQRLNTFTSVSPRRKKMPRNRKRRRKLKKPRTKKSRPPKMRRRGTGLNVIFGILCKSRRTSQGMKPEDGTLSAGCMTYTTISQESISWRMARLCTVCLEFLKKSSLPKVSHSTISSRPTRNGQCCSLSSRMQTSCERHNPTMPTSLIVLSNYVDNIHKFA